MTLFDDVADSPFYLRLRMLFFALPFGAWWRLQYGGEVIFPWREICNSTIYKWFRFYNNPNLKNIL